MPYDILQRLLLNRQVEGEGLFLFYPFRWHRGTADLETTRFNENNLRRINFGQNLFREKTLGLCGDF